MSKSSFRRLDFFANEIIFLNVVTNKSTLQEMSLLCLPWLVQADIKKVIAMRGTLEPDVHFLVANI